MLSALAFLAFVLCTVIAVVIAMNLLIAIMGDSYDRVQENKAVHGRIERAEVLVAINWLVRRTIPKKLYASRRRATNTAAAAAAASVFSAARMRDQTDGLEHQAGGLSLSSLLAARHRRRPLLPRNHQPTSPHQLTQEAKNDGLGGGKKCEM